MSGINVDITEMQNALADMQTAIGEFKTISESAFSSEISTLQGMKQAVRKNFEDMDFENAMKRNEAESLVISMEDCIQRRINSLSGMGFE